MSESTTSGSVLVFVHRPADDAAVAQVADGGEVQLAFASGELGDVSDPAQVRSFSAEHPLQPIGRRGDVGVGPVATSGGRRGAADLRPSHHPAHSGHVLHTGRHPWCRRHPQRRLQVVADQGVLERGSGVAHRDRDQRPHRSWLPTPAAQPARAASRARAANTRLLMLQRVGQGCAISTALFERIALPSVRRANEPEPCASGIHASWPWPAPCALSPHHRRLHQPEPSRPRRRPPRRGLQRLPDELRPAPSTTQTPRRSPPRHQHLGTHPDGARFALFYSKVHDRVLTPLCGADHPPAPVESRHALRTVDHHIDICITDAHIRRQHETRLEYPKPHVQGSPRNR